MKENILKQKWAKIMKKHKYKKPKWLIKAEQKAEKMTLEEEKEWIEKAIRVYKDKGIDGLFEI
ncbi:hypothetical protein MJ_1153 [Methanocaldococcus jannaschii DSM 2661]|uniref:Uncharacterized protein MJ1153 n=1 Tax=Methanocaldococcus jannaschii (strain ATCC 43067 / DSM 2661 / JAL-1 / JCM 10045 / NBRC 100440) TaxID=243232 RepID=Y1153_METJA|nr:RecName: Full=Uncharacterized protein MJ1153 [Methanocaldococcus jannaschii DSM 2661]AAB99159.1 hypothetical protein MJ_1153 [Methanocaldococcus jannaschii DSM 2661]